MPVDTKPTSFMCERTAEYMLVSHLCTLLAVNYGKVVPFFFWATREGSSISRRCDFGERVQLISVFARRPKVLSPGADSVLMKVNHELLETVEVSVDSGIPVFAGVPLVSAVQDATLGAACAVFELRALPGGGEDLEVSIGLDGEVLSTSGCASQVSGPLLVEEVVEIIGRLARPMTWLEAIEELRHIRSVHWEVRSPWPRFGGYRPFHLMLRKGE